MDNGAGVGCNAGNNEYYCGSACRQLSAGTTPTLSHCQNNFQVCAPGVDCSNSYAAAYPCGVPQACNGGFTLCNIAGTGASSFPDSKCKANAVIPTGCITYNQCTNVCSACSAGYELLAGNCVGATVRLGTDSVMSDRLKNSTMPLMSILSSGYVGVGTTIPNDIFSIGNSGSAPLGSLNTGHNYTSTYLSADDYALTNYGLVKTLIASATSSSALWGGIIGGNIWNLNSGNVGIGTTNPGALLDINAGSAGTSIIRFTASSGVNVAQLGFVAGYGAVVGATSGNSMYVQGTSIRFVNQNLSTEWMRIQNDGTVGIGTTTPRAKLDVLGNINATAANGNYIQFSHSGSEGVITTNTGSFSFGPATGLAYVFKSGVQNFFRTYGSSGGANYIQITHDNTNGILSTGVGNLVLSPIGGNVGIGTSAPNDTLSIGNSGSAPVGSLATGHNFTSTYLTTDDYALTNYGIVKSLISSSATTNALWNGTKNGNIWNGDAGVGNVGIGTTSPSATLHVYNSMTGVLKVQGDGVGGPSRSAILDLVGIGARASGVLIDNTGGTPWFIGQPYGTGDVLQIGRHATQPEYPANAFMTILNSGNVGIGTTNPVAKLTVGVVGGSSPVGTVLAMSGILSVGTSAQFQISGLDNGGITYYAASGTVMTFNTSAYNNPITFSQMGVDRLRISNSGNVGIGMTNPSQKLDVDGVISSGGYSTAGEVRSYQANGLAGNYFVSLKTDTVLSKNGLYVGNTGKHMLYYDTASGGTNLDSMTAAFPIKFNINGVEKMRVDSNGNVGIGTTIPNDIFSIGNSGSAPIGSDHTGHNYTMTYLSSDPYALVNYGTTMSLINAATSSNALWNGTKNGSIYNGDAGAGSVGIGTTTPSAPLEVIGTSNTTGSVRITAPNVGDAPWMEFSTPGVGIMGRITNSNGFRFKSNYDVSMVAGAGAGNGFKVWNPAATVQYLTILGSNGNVGIGTSTPAQQLTLTKSLSLEKTTSSDVGVIYKDGKRFIHNYFGPGTNGGNLFIGEEAGNFTMASSGQAYHTQQNVGVGFRALYSLTTGYNNLAFGTNAMKSMTSGPYNTAIGNDAMANSTGASWGTAFGTSAMSNSNGSFNTGIGRNALNYNNGSYNLAVGFDAGFFIADGVTNLTGGSNNTYLGSGVRAKTNNDTNSTVIGSNAISAGSNTVVLGNDSVLTTLLKGNVGINNVAPNDALSIGNAGSAPLGSVNTGHNYTSTYLSADDYALTNYGLVKTLIASATSSSALFGGTVAGNIWSLNTGNFGIGTTTPAAKLDLVGLMKMRVATSSITQAEDVVNKAYLDFKIGTANTVGKYVGVTVATYSGNNSALGVGYDKANDQCAVDVPGSHVCATSEILNTIATKGAMPTDSIVWVFNGPPGYTVEANDCDGRASNRSTSYGAVWQTDISKWTNGRGMLTTCNNSNKFACCK